MYLGILNHLSSSWNILTLYREKMCLVCQKYDLLTIAYIALHQFEVSCIYSKKRPNQISKFQIFSSLRMSQIQNDSKGYMSLCVLIFWSFFLVAIFLRCDQVQEFEFSYIRADWAWSGPLTQVDFTPQRVLA